MDRELHLPASSAFHHWSKKCGLFDHFTSRMKGVTIFYLKKEVCVVGHLAEMKLPIYLLVINNVTNKLIPILGI
jgi:hypothetical protein